MNTVPAAAPLEIRRTIDATPAETWTAWTEPDLLARWFAPGQMRAEVLAYELRVGRRYRIRMRDPDGSTHTVGGVFVVITPQQRLVMTWAWESPDAQESRVSVDFEDRDAGTGITIRHEGLPDEASATSHRKGWEGCLDNLVRRIGSF
jgi:uncharacterized protein YndB with AHSA1/START domain